jgi:dTDP-glucose 4,6-dehydratase
MPVLDTADLVGAHVVVLGGAGFLGSHLAEHLLGLGAEVTVVDDFITGHDRNTVGLLGRPGYRLIDQDITYGFRVPLPVDWVVNMASPASPIDYLRWPIETLTVGATGTLNGLELAQRAGATFVLASTSEVYGDPLESPQRESYWGHVNPTGPRGVYDEAKRYAEALTLAYHRDRGVDVRIARIFNTYGPRMRLDDGRAVPAFFLAALDGQPQPVHGDGSQTRSLCYVDDLIDGITRLMLSKHVGPVNLGRPEEISVLGLAHAVQDAVGSRSGVVHEDRPVDDPTVRRPDITLARRVLGWEPRVTLEEGLARTAPWFREQFELHTAEKEALPVVEPAAPILPALEMR